MLSGLENAGAPDLRSTVSLCHAQNAKDRALALYWTRDMLQASKKNFSSPAPSGAAAVSLSARAQRGMIMHAHAAHRTQLLESFLAICGGRQEVKHSTSMMLCRSCASKRGTRHKHMGRDMADGGRGAWAVRLCTSHAKPFLKTYPPGPELAVAAQSCCTGIYNIR